MCPLRCVQVQLHFDTFFQGVKQARVKGDEDMRHEEGLKCLVVAFDIKCLEVNSTN